MRRLACALLIAAVGSGPAAALDFWAVEVLGGGAVSASSTLEVRQEGEPDLEHDARWETRPFDSPPYYAFRFAFGEPTGWWEVQFLHHKAYLQNPTAEIQHFELTHGLNLLTFHRVWERSVSLRAGLGIALPHTDSTVRGRISHGGGGILGTGYRLAGPALVAGVGKRFPFGGGRWHLVPELQVTATRVNVEIADGDATTSNVALHFLLGLGWGSG